MSGRPLSLFEGYGIEIESVVVDAESLAVRPIVDELLREATGGSGWAEDVDDGEIGWSNELVSHVVELKTNGPAPGFEGLAERFRASSGRLRKLAEGHGARLLPTAMHPWMDPTRETVIWRHESSPVYRAYHALFDCHRHGWSNVQSVHLNLPFADESELVRLHAAARLVLPLIPALAASSPILEGRATGLLDSRLDHYRTNSARVPSMTGAVVPEPLRSIDEYRERVVATIDRELTELGADEVLLGREWTNARGAIVRFDRMALEVRLIDAQECAAADLALCAAVSAFIRDCVEERWAPLERQLAMPTDALCRTLSAATALGPEAELGDAELAALLGAGQGGSTRLGDLWRTWAEGSFAAPRELEAALGVVLRRGVLAQRILAALGPGFEGQALRDVYGELCDCLDEGRSFRP